MQLCLEGWDQALSLLTNLQRCQVLSLQMSRGETPSTERPPQPTQSSLLSSARAVVVPSILGQHLLTYIFTPSPSPSSEGLWGTKARHWACAGLLQARRCSCISQPCRQCHGWGMRCGDYSSSAHFQLITQGERARLWALHKMDTDPVASWKLRFPPVEHLSGCINPLLALSSPLHTMETSHP